MAPGIAWRTANPRWIGGLSPGTSYHSFLLGSHCHASFGPGGPHAKSCGFCLRRSLASFIMLHPLSIKARWFLVLTFVGACVAGVAWLTHGPSFVAAVWQAKDLLIGWCRTYPLVMFAALVLLPAFGFPASALLLLAGAIWGATGRVALWLLVPRRSICLGRIWLQLGPPEPSSRGFWVPAGIAGGVWGKRTGSAWPSFCG